MAFIFGHLVLTPPEHAQLAKKPLFIYNHRTQLLGDYILFFYSNKTAMDGPFSLHLPFSERRRNQKDPAWGPLPADGADGGREEKIFFFYIWFMAW